MTLGGRHLLHCDALVCFLEEMKISICILDAVSILGALTDVRVILIGETKFMSDRSIRQLSIIMNNILR